MQLRRWHRLGVILTVIGGIGVFYAVFTRGGELAEDVYYRQTNECRVAERRGLPAEQCYRDVDRDRARVVREKAEEAAAVSAAAIVAAWIAAFVSIGLYRWVMAGPPNGASRPPREGGGEDRGAARRRRRKRIEPRI